MIYLSLLFVKHYYVDFVLQTNEMVAGKGKYGNITGLHHSLQHAIFTFLLTLSFVYDPTIAFAFAMTDMVLHYHIDWLKMNFGNRDITTPMFWNHLGLDQLAHSLMYIVLATLLML